MNTDNNMEKEENKSSKNDIIIHKVNDGETVYEKKENNSHKEPPINNNNTENKRVEDRMNRSNPNPKRRKRKKKKSVNIFLIVVFAFITGSVFTICLLKWSPITSYLDSSPKNGFTTSKNRSNVYEKTSLNTSIAKVYNSVFMVESYKGEQEYSTGTGFFYKTDEQYAYAITNQHVVAGCDKVELILADDSKIDATITGGDEYLDIAVLKVDKNKAPMIATIGKSDDILVGDTVFTVGSPMGYEYRGTVTSGILSGKDRLVSVSVSNSNSNDWVMKVLQIDAAINPGNSGGPLVNINGEVIGVTSMKLVQDEIEGMGFAIPIEIAMAHLSELEAGKKIEWPVLGISMANVTDTSLLYRNNIVVNEDINYGVVVVAITKGSGAASSSLKEGDIITKINGETVKDSAYLRYELYKNRPGDTIEITYVRGGKEKTTKITLSKANS